MYRSSYFVGDRQVTGADVQVWIKSFQVYDVGGREIDVQVF